MNGPDDRSGVDLTEQLAEVTARHARMTREMDAALWESMLGPNPKPVSITGRFVGPEEAERLLRADGWGPS